MIEVGTQAILEIEALQYARRGWPVFPCKAREKQPLTSSGFRNATTDEDQIRAWWSKWPDANIGIATGNGLFVLDVDGSEGLASIEGKELPRAPRVKTSKGFHVYFKSQEELRCFTRRLPGLDGRGEGGYIIAPPSVHPSGEVYEWLVMPSELPLPECPPWLAELARGRIVSQEAARDQEDMIPAGQRNAALASLAGSMRRRGMCSASIEAALLAENAARCTPPLDEEEVRRIAGSVGRYPPEGSQEQEPSILDLLSRPCPDRATAPETVWLFPRRHFAVLASDPGRGKSILSMKAAADLTLGLPVLGGKKEPPRRVLFLNGEASKGIFDYRFRSSGWGFAPERFAVIHSEECQAAGATLDLDSMKGRDNIELLTEHHKPDLCVIDSLPAFFNGDQNDSQAMNDISRFLKGLASRHGMAVLLVHHLRKRRLQDNESEISLNEIQGSNAILKLAGTVVGIEERQQQDEEGTKPLRIVKCLKSWLRTFPSFSYEIGEDEDDRLTLSVGFDLPADQRKASAWDRIKRAFSNGAALRREAVQDVCQVSDKTAKKYLGDWVALGRLERIGSGKGTEYRILSG